MILHVCQFVWCTQTKNSECFTGKIVERFLTFPLVLGDQWIQFQRKKPIRTPAVSLVLLPILFPSMAF